MMNILAINLREPSYAILALAVVLLGLVALWVAVSDLLRAIRRMVLRRAVKRLLRAGYAPAARYLTDCYGLDDGR